MLDAGMRLKRSTVFNGDETVLVVDDIESVRSFLNDALPMFGYSVICAEDGMDGLEKFRDNKDRINILLLDVVMPKLNGIELFKEINKAEPNIKALFMSGEKGISDSYDLQDKIKCICKPFEIMTLLREMREVLDSQ
jgi:DNA-binding response OmpR family regulator